MLVTVVLLVAGVMGLLWGIDRYRPNRWSLIAAGLVLWVISALTDSLGLWLLAWLVLLIALVCCVPWLRRQVLVQPTLKYIRAVLPPMSETERAAIDAGTVWWDAELFRGEPQWQTLLNAPACRLSEDEQRFLDNEVHTLCAMLNDWSITHEQGDLPAEVWDYLKAQGFFGLIIPKEHGGRGFSAYGHSQVVLKIASRSASAAVTVMVPNSLGPAELLMHYGTEAQQQYYLPRLAKGEEIPCFSLTSPWAGSDAAAILDRGRVGYGQYQGEKVLGLWVNWEKRYITLGPVATVIGLAFIAEDPDGLLGEPGELGMSCALIPADTPGVSIGRRHNPMGQAFMNGPNQGKDVFVPMSWLIGGQAQLGHGWQMLMDCLSVGRGISLPTLSTASGMHASWTTGAYARLRQQFGLSIGRFEGVEEAMARIAGFTYMMDATRQLTCAAIDLGEKPSVISAITKYINTELGRQVLNDAMDVHGGRGICQGPSNYLAAAYQAVPVGITVEGANILTRSLIIFGQGALRCHPYLIDEIQAASNPNQAEATEQMDAALMAHIGYSVRNGARALLHGLTRGRLAKSPVTDESAKFFRRLERLSAAYAFLADMAMLVLGGDLKRKEALSGRFADALSYLFVCSAVLKRYHDSGRPAHEEALMNWSARYCLWQSQQALDGILRNFPLPLLGTLLRWIVFPLGRRFRTPRDDLGSALSRLLMSDGVGREALAHGIYKSQDPEDITGCLEHALALRLAVEPLYRRLREQGHAVQRSRFRPWLDECLAQGVITEAEHEQLLTERQATRRAIDVDDFAKADFLAGTPTDSAPAAKPSELG